MVDIKKADEPATVDMDFNGKEVKPDKYSGKYSDGEFWNKVKSTVKKAGLGLIHNAMKLYYVTENPNCPMKVKAGIIAALGYFISPFDLIPDFTPIVGYSDDASAIGVAIVMAQMYIDAEVERKAKEKLCSIFGDSILAELE